MSDETDAPPPSGEAGSREGATTAAAGGAPEGRRRRRRRRRGGHESGDGGGEAQGADGDGGDEGGEDGGEASAAGANASGGGGGGEGGGARRDERPQTGRPPREGREARGPQGGPQRQRQEARGGDGRNDGRGDPRSRGERGERGEVRSEPRAEGQLEGRSESRSEGRAGEGDRGQQRPARGQGGPESGQASPNSGRGPGGGRNGDRVRRDRSRGGQPPQGGPSASAGASPASSPAPNREQRRDGQGNRDGRPGGRDRDRDRDRDRGRGGDPRNQRRGEAGGEGSRDARAEEDDDLSAAEAAQIGSSSLAAEPRESVPRLGDRMAAPPATPWDDEEEASPSSEAKVDWGKEDDGPAAAVTLPPTLPAEPAGEHDPPTQLLDEATDTRGPRGDVVSVVGVRFAAAGRVSLYDSGGAYYATGDQVLVDGERGPRVGMVAVATERRTTSDRGLRRVMRLANAGDVEREVPSAERARQALRLAKDRTAELKLPVKVFRAEFLGNGGRNDKLLLYITTEERIDLRDLLRDLGNATGARVELRQLGARDEAKAVGGIGSCGLTLCCTTWLPEFVPVSIKMAKDQGLVLNPQKVAGQCGRLKCCLVYEQAGYAELRKGLPKLGKRVITARGDGRVVEVDVLRQRVRVSYGPGESEVVPAGDVRPMFPSGNTPPSGRRDGRGPADDDGDGDEEADADGDLDGRAHDSSPPDLSTELAGLADEADAAAPGQREPEPNA